MDENYFKYQITLPFKGISDSFKKQAWCHENVKDENWKLTSTRFGSQDWLFVHEEDAFKFTLIWS